MIGYLHGVVRAEDIVDVNGVGYQVTCPQALPMGESVDLHVVTVVRDDNISLYGFTSPAEKALYQALVKVSGVGPVAALSLIGALGVSGVAGAIQAQDTATLSKVKGIGARTAQSIVTLCSVPTGIAVAGAVSDLISALVGLGIPASDASDAAHAAHRAHPDASDTDLLTAALAQHRNRVAARTGAGA